jgi:hypothetical protein
MLFWLHWCSSRNDLAAVLVTVSVLPVLCPAQTSVLTYHNDNSRTGQNLSETRLTPENVNASSFGKLFNLIVDGKVDAQPLYIPNLVIPGSGTHNVVFVMTEHDSAYAFDADTGTNLWQVSVLKPGETTSDSRRCAQVAPEIGITATPVIDMHAGPHGTIYLIGMSKDASGNYYQRLHALDITSGAEQFGGPVDIRATYPGMGETSANGLVTFDPKQYKERAALLLINGVVYTSWTSHCDIQPYTGWTIGYDQSTLAQVAVFNFAPNGGEASIWSSGAGPAVDANGDLYFQIANGTFDTALNAQGFPSLNDYGNAFLRLRPVNGQLQPADYWTMYDTVAESGRDEDLGSGGALLIPDVRDAAGLIRHLGVGAGKDGNIYLFDRDNMGRFNPRDNSNIYQELPNALPSGEFGMPAWFNGTVYFGGVGDVIKAFTLSTGRLSALPVSATNTVFPYPGSTPSISASGTSNAILWAAENSNPAVLHAYDATNLSRELYNSNQAPGGRDQFGVGNKFIVPTVADGKVFVGTQNSVGVFGLLNSTTVQSAPTSTSITTSVPAATSGTAVALSAIVSSSSGTPTGSVVFSDGGATLGSAALDGNGSAVLSVSNFTVGIHPVSAAYTGSTGFLQSTSAPVQIVIVPVQSAQTSFTISQVMVPAGVSLGSATLAWNAPSAAVTEVHVGAPDGPLFARSNSSGTASTGAWVSNGLIFYLQDATPGKALDPQNTLALATAQLQLAVEAGYLIAAANPVRISPGQLLASATLNWNTSTASVTEVHVGAADGPLFARGGPQANATTEGWVSDGTTFFLQDVSNGQPLNQGFTIATQTLRLSEVPSNVSFQASPNPIIAPATTGLGSSTLFWNAPDAFLVEVHLNSPAGPLFARGLSMGSVTAPGWVQEGLVFYLQDISGGKPLSPQNTLATVTMHVVPGSAQ